MERPRLMEPGPLVTFSAGEHEGASMAKGSPTLWRMTPEQAEAELLWLERQAALHSNVEAVLIGWWAPDAHPGAGGLGPRQRLARALTELAKAAERDARKADMLAGEMSPW